MIPYDRGIYETIGLAVQFVLGMTGIGLLLRLLVSRRPRWRIARHRRGLPEWWLRLTASRRDSPALRERAALLSGCGWRWPPEAYLATRRTLLGLMTASAAASYVLRKGDVVPDTLSGYALLALAIAAGGVYFDSFSLEAIKRYRTERIRREIVIVSNQLLYYAGSRLHLHGKLMRCLPYTRLMRWEMQLMLNDWYHDADAAIAGFRDRMGTGEAYSFSEILRSLRLNESDEVFDLLREAIADYKARIELAKAGRKETMSYMLFVLAGLPIMYMFQIFLYPWVQQSSRLFNVLNQ